MYLKIEFDPVAKKHVDIIDKSPWVWNSRIIMPYDDVRLWSTNSDSKYPSSNGWQFHINMDEQSKFT